MRTDYVALRLRLLAPSIARYEIFNALRYLGGFGSEDLVKASRALEDYQFPEIPPSGRYGEEAARLAMNLGITIYDSSYLAIGKLRNVDFFTADDGPLKKVEELDFARHIKEYARKPRPRKGRA